MTAFGSCHYSLCLLYSSMGAPQVQGYFNFNKRNLFQCPKVFHKQNFNFSVPRHSKQIKLKIKTVQQITSGIWEMKGGKCTKTLDRKDSGHKNIPYTRYPKCFTQIYRDLYVDAMLVPTWMGTNMADGNLQKHLLPSFCIKA